MENIEGGSGFLQEPLTRRERNILAHLANDRSSQEIAGLEMLAYSSVKWYIHQIYAKLGVSRRSEAITRAKELDLLQPEPAALDARPRLKTTTCPASFPPSSAAKLRSRSSWSSCRSGPWLP